MGWGPGWGWGAMTFGDDHGWGTSPAEAADILAAYLDRGGNSIDTANIYTGGHSERIIGDYFAAHQDRRDRVVLESATIAQFRGWAPGTALQLEYSLLERTSEGELIPAAIALAWVQGRPGISSTIIGARRLDQLVANLAAAEVTLTEDQRQRLDEVSAPQLGFPAVANHTAPRLAFGGTTVDGQAGDEFPTLASASNRY